MTQKGFSNIFLIIGVVCVLLVGLYLYLQSYVQNSQMPTQPINDSSTSPVAKEITYQSEIKTASSSSGTVFIERDSSKEALYVADNNLSEDSKKLINEFSFPSAVSYTPPVLTAGDYLIMPYAGGDGNDIVIFTPEGKLITERVSQSNPDIMNWQVSIKPDTVKDNRVTIQLFRIDSSSAEAVIDLSTGKVIPGSFKNLPKAE